MSGWSQGTVRRGRGLSARGRWIGLGVLAALAMGAPTPASAQQAPERTGSHTVDRGDTLWDLARRYLANPFRWPEIYQANTSVVEDPHWIYPGELLTLPDAARVAPPMETAAALPSGVQDVKQHERLGRMVGESGHRLGAPLREL